MAVVGVAAYNCVYLLLLLSDGFKDDLEILLGFLVLCTRSTKRIGAICSCVVSVDSDHVVQWREPSSGG